MLHRARALSPLVGLTLAATLVAAGDGDGACEAREIEFKDEIVAYEACESQVWFTDERPGLGNLAETGMTTRPTWSTEPPAGSYQQGDGYMTVASPYGRVADSADRTNSAVFVGSFEGTVDTMSITLHGSHFGYTATADPATRQGFHANVELYIDGVPVVPVFLIEDMPLKEADNATGLDQYEFTFTNVVKGMLRGGLDLEGPHEIEVVITPNYVNTGAYQFFVYGTTEVDGGIVFNDLDLPEDALVVKA